MLEDSNKGINGKLSLSNNIIKNKLKNAKKYRNQSETDFYFYPEIIH